MEVFQLISTHTRLYTQHNITVSDGPAEKTLQLLTNHTENTINVHFVHRDSETTDWNPCTLMFMLQSGTDTVSSSSSLFHSWGNSTHTLPCNREMFRTCQVDVPRMHLHPSLRTSSLMCARLLSSALVCTPFPQLVSSKRMHSFSLVLKRAKNQKYR